MDWAKMWEIVNEPAFIAGLAGALLWALNKLFAWKPTWERWKGTVIRAIKFAEAEIPDDADSKAARRLDAALQYAIKVIEAAEGRTVKHREREELRDGISRVHAEMEAAGNVPGADK